MNFVLLKIWFVNVLCTNKILLFGFDFIMIVYTTLRYFNIQYTQYSMHAFADLEKLNL